MLWVYTARLILRFRTLLIPLCPLVFWSKLATSSAAADVSSCQGYRSRMLRSPSRAQPLATRTSSSSRGSTPITTTYPSASGKAPLFFGPGQPRLHHHYGAPCGHSCRHHKTTKKQEALRKRVDVPHPHRAAQGTPPKVPVVKTPRPRTKAVRRPKHRLQALPRSSLSEELVLLSMETPRREFAGGIRRQGRHALLHPERATVRRRSGWVARQGPPRRRRQRVRRARS